jgi:hypothetical protein
MLVAEIDKSMSRRKTNNVKEENDGADEQPSSKINKKKIQYMKNTRCHTNSSEICAMFNNFLILSASCGAVQRHIQLENLVSPHYHDLHWKIAESKPYSPFDETGFKSVV